MVGLCGINFDRNWKSLLKRLDRLAKHPPIFKPGISHLLPLRRIVHRYVDVVNLSRYTDTENGFEAWGISVVNEYFRKHDVPLR